MAEPVYHGICLSCIHARTCRYALNAVQPVHFCEMYEVNGMAVQDVPPEVPRWRTRSDGETADRFKGLCIDCMKRFECADANSETGVWHCGEYQGSPAQ